ncbi:hypothetical protein CD30_15275 [Ureibacillus massiliensis 4400831 = CIP 108448 = CCUG 49529]|uniref:Uncharacterized protein n=1 Tax=Ureibacillus massiliensis 4400831 = CIP 108448 = CCUG 49529 TaxID=1211035 RepID=A0A0A3IYG5_9BACL|nr:hypothetical protein [Ureibacillus massiliensis]KGR89784.1 hypothetical protein CD30_15275 [Ureibacillus massiliensis 4400831 = CIP 108448 = CCUG 49529]BDH63594.1 hypothetical protein MTP04_37240 [Lysinibacillus sp. PLM2]
MDYYKLMLYVNILGICLPIALTYLVIANLIIGQPIYPSTVVILAFGYAVMIKWNTLFQELWQKWFGKEK